MSAFSARDLRVLATPSAYQSPLAIIAHIDLDAFYAQCEQVRLGLPTDAPVVCRQWHSLIAVNYPARAFGIRRGDTIKVALEKCPELHAPHVATYKRNSTTWAYHPDPNPEDYKVSLDPFRRESRRIFGIFKQHCARIEKIGSDEGFLDLGPYVYERVLELYPELAKLEEADSLPECPKDPLTFRGVIFGQLAESGDLTQSNQQSDSAKVSEQSGLVALPSTLVPTILKPKTTLEPKSSSTSPSIIPLDWDDILFWLADKLVAQIRSQLLAEIGYTCSGGIAQNKIVAKLATGRNKPNNATIILNRHKAAFVRTVEFTDMWGQGGKFGDQVVKRLGAPEKGSVEFISKLSREHLERHFEVLMARRIFEMVRGDCATEIVTRTEIKSMQSIKNFRKPIKSLEECKEWLKVFAADLANRVLELDLDHAVVQRPRKITIHHTHYEGSSGNSKTVTKSRVGAFAAMTNNDLDFDGLSAIIFEGAVTLIRQVEAEGTKVFPCSIFNLSVTSFEAESRSVSAFFKKGKDVKTIEPEESKQVELVPDEPHSEPNETENDIFVTDTFTCPSCQKTLTSEQEFEHMDWHFALKLQQQDNLAASPPKKQKTGTTGKVSKVSKTSKTSKTNKTSKDQSILKFFKS